mgnify:CR=1 FL=1
MTTLAQAQELFFAALDAQNRKQFDSAERLYREALALAHGGSCEGAPGVRPHYHSHYYGAYFRDPDGSLMEFMSYGDTK